MSRQTWSAVTIRVFIVPAERGTDRLSEEVRERGAAMRRDGEEAEVYGSGDQEGEGRNCGCCGSSEGAKSQGNYRFGGKEKSELKESVSKT